MGQWSQSLPGQPPPFWPLSSKKNSSSPGHVTWHTASYSARTECLYQVRFISPSHVQLYRFCVVFHTNRLVKRSRIRLLAHTHWPLLLRGPTLCAILTNQVLLKILATMIGSIVSKRKMMESSDREVLLVGEWVGLEFPSWGALRGRCWKIT